LMALRTLLAHPAQCKSTLSTMGCGPAAALPPSFFFSPPASLSAAFFPFPMAAACLVEWSGWSGGLSRGVWAALVLRRGLRGWGGVK
jgi:hypothetical protein